MNDATKSASIAPFKSARAAQIHMTKAENAYKAALIASNVRYDSEGQPMSWEDMAPARAAVTAAWERGHAVNAQACSQGFYVSSWFFGHNPTRDLISANID